jgi:hypothetical protein
MTKKAQEITVSSATYRRCGICLTTLGRYIVNFPDGTIYPAASLSDAKTMIDDFYKTKQN